MKPILLPSFYIKLDGNPYQGKQDETEAAPPRNAYHSPISRNKLKVGHPLDTPIFIQGNRNLRSHIDRILTCMAEGQRITSIEITQV